MLRGVAIAVMALDHTRDFFASGGFNPRDVTDPALFLTRWVTHFCAPVFVLLAGMSAFLSGVRERTNWQLSRLLFTRGLWLIFLELTVVRFAWTFSVFPDFVLLQIIWVIGISMVGLAGLIHLPRWAVGAFAVCLISAHNLLDGIQADQFGRFSWLWNVLHEPVLMQPTPDTEVFALYSVIPWIGVMAAGYSLGPVMLLEQQKRSRLLIGLGGVLVIGFLIVRATNLYGDPASWEARETLGATVLSFLNTEKYPPSLLFLAMTIGPALLALAGFEKMKGKWIRPLITFGSVPLFIYVAHLFLIHMLAVTFAAATIGETAWLFGGLPIEMKPDGYGLGLPGVYMVWLLVLMLLYLPCRWYAQFKHRRADWWLSYL